MLKRTYTRCGFMEDGLGFCQNH